MDQSQVTENGSKKRPVRTPTRNTLLKKVDLGTTKLLQQIKEKVNKKLYGRMPTSPSGSPSRT